MDAEVPPVGKKQGKAARIVAVAREFEMKRIERTRTNNTFAENFDYESKIGLILDSRHVCVPEAWKNLTWIFSYESIKLYIINMFL